MAITRSQRLKLALAKDGSPAQAFPDHLVLEIVARCRTAGDVIRCAATSKPIRSGILSKPFLRHLVLDGDGNGDFIPALLVGLYHKITNDDPDRPLPFVPVPGGRGNKQEYPLPPAPDDPSASSCRYGSTSRGATACNPTTGERLVLPPHDLMDTSHAVLQVTHPLAPSAFKLLLAELSEHAPKTLYVQIFSSEDGYSWGDVFPCAISRSCEFVPGAHGRPASPAVVGDTVYWMCNTGVGRRVLSWRWRGNAGGDQPQKASLRKLPSSFVFGDVETCLAALPSQSSSASLLGLIVLEERGDIQVWVHEDRRGGRFAWGLRHRVQGTPPLGFRDWWFDGKEIVCFCEGSGTLFLRDGDGVNNLTSMQLSLDNNNNNNKAVRKLEATTTWDLPSEAQFCPYQIDLLSHMLCGMKTY
ncbi:hypothetical protein QOZ80_1BG0076650 [Eleusine coracana subsp. coracana]|nr:hypothetical protein QOZ80_1BG0076650 [Eleusine coracana subsp. coracana]